jgi:hypothetical protein
MFKTTNPLNQKGKSQRLLAFIKLPLTSYLFQSWLETILPQKARAGTRTNQLALSWGHILATSLYHTLTKR